MFLKFRIFQSENNIFQRLAVLVTFRDKTKEHQEAVLESDQQMTKQERESNIFLFRTICKNLCPKSVKRLTNLFGPCVYIYI